ncbi:MAG TPA: mannose-1-phosphate guanylyltransferase [Anaerolineae bacterium]
MQALILAGGTGTRLWPQSRNALPKQLLDLVEGGTMMQATVNGILPIIPIENIFIASNRVYGPLIKEQIPDLPKGNIIEEPSAKHTAPCIGLGAVHMGQADTDQVMASLHADHFIADEEGFRQGLLAAEEVARQGYLVTLGIQPTGPETGYGYVQRGAELGRYNDQLVYEAAGFLEKPDLATAQRFVDEGTYYWNSGIFIWQISTLLEAFQNYMPEFYDQLGQLEQAVKAGQVIDSIWATIRPQSIDVGIMERANKVAIVPVDIGWNDVGSWAAIHAINPTNEHNNVALGAEHIAFETEGTLVQGNGRLIATIGLKDVIIVDSGDAILVCAKDKAQDVKKVVDWLKQNGRTDLL